MFIYIYTGGDPTEQQHKTKHNNKDIITSQNKYNDMILITRDELENGQPKRKKIQEKKEKEIKVNNTYTKHTDKRTHKHTHTHTHTHIHTHSIIAGRNRICVITRVKVQVFRSKLKYLCDID